MVNVFPFDSDYSTPKGTLRSVSFTVFSLSVHSLSKYELWFKWEFKGIDTEFCILLLDCKFSHWEILVYLLEELLWHTRTFCSLWSISFPQIGNGNRRMFYKTGINSKI